MSDASGPSPQPILASDAEREHSVTLLREAVGEGRLTLEEFSQRVDLAYAARTDQELAVIVRDLPPALATGPAVAAHPSLAAHQPLAADQPPAALAPSAEVAPPAETHLAFCSHLIRSGPWALPRRSAWRSLFGTIALDLTQARLAGPEVTLEVYNLFGTVTVIVPAGIEVTVRGGGLFASQKIDAPAHTPVAGAPRLLIDTRGPGGTLYVRTTPPPKSGALVTALRQVLERERHR